MRLEKRRVIRNISRAAIGSSLRACVPKTNFAPLDLLEADPAFALARVDVAAVVAVSDGGIDVDHDGAEHVVRIVIEFRPPRQTREPIRPNSDCPHVPRTTGTVDVRDRGLDRKFCK
jgi:hypothetical protein